MYNVVIGQDLSCYATIQIPEDPSLTEEALIEIVNQVRETGEWMGDEVQFEEDWSTVCATRIVNVRNKNDLLFEDIKVEPSPYDAGQVVESWLNGRGSSLDDVIKSAAKSRLIDEPVMEAYRGIFQIHGEEINVEFECRKGATRAERDMAFLDALAQKGAVNYHAV